MISQYFVRVLIGFILEYNQSAAKERTLNKTAIIPIKNTDNTRKKK